MINTKKYFTVKNWKKFSIESQELLLKKYDVILTDHMTRKERYRKILKAILRPTPKQKIRQKQKLNHAIEKVQDSIDKFDQAIDYLSTSLRKQSGSGHDDDPVELIMGKKKKFF